MYLLPNTHKKVFILHTYYLGRYIISVQSENWHRSSLLKTNKQITHSSSMFTRNWKKENSICERLGLPTKVWIHNAIELKLATYLEYILRIRVFHFHHLIGSYRLEWWKIFDFSLGMQWEVAWCCLTIFLKKNWKLIEKWKICKAG